MTTCGDVGTEIAPEVADDPRLAARGADFTAEDEERIGELAAFAGATLGALRATRRPE